MSDSETKLAEKIGWMAGMGDRNGRWAMVLENGVVRYAEKESNPRQVTVCAIAPLGLFRLEVISDYLDIGVRS